MSPVVHIANGEEKKLAYQLRYSMMCEKLGWLPHHGYAYREEQDEYDNAQSMTFMLCRAMINVSINMRIPIFSAIRSWNNTANAETISIVPFI